MEDFVKLRGRIQQAHTNEILEDPVLTMMNST